ncbi:MAG: Eco57I restriction-modification methylase domain-containing protein, partial [Nanoarchaeota archaeon]|nr:Eco57I restriction-modification methylase domain-containing protein [Nanoarchaeota archaeon]
SRRKKEGIFYTPEYITDYICRNTIITYLSKKGINSVPELIKEYAENIEELEEKFKSIKILDPACGSGAFLIKATDVMLEVFKEIQEFKQSEGEYEAKKGLKKKSNAKGQLVLEKWNEEAEAREIIENSIHGVDINEESVEITKLSLFLKMARKNRKLTDLSNNIKQGNSLINDEVVAGKLAFDWEKEFPFKFDVVIGNPPYVKARDYEDIVSRKYIDEKYQTTYKMWDLYVPFIEKGINLIKENGNFSMIIPDTIGKAEYTSKLVDWIESNYHLYQIDFFPDIYVFENVGVKSKIIFIKKQKSSKKGLRFAHTPDITTIKKLDSLDGKEKYLYDQSKINLKFEECINLDNICLVSYGLRLNSDKHDKKGKFKKEDLLSEKRTEINNKSYTEGKFLERYVITIKLFVEWGTERSPVRLVRPTFPELYPPKKILMSRQKRIASLSTDGEICDNTIIMGILVKDLHGVENNSISKYFKNIGGNRAELEKISENYELEYLLSLINSTLMRYFIKYNSKGAIDTYPDDWKKIPIKTISISEQKPFIEKADSMLSLNKNFYDKKNKFFNRIQKSFSLEKLNKKIDSFYELDFNDFVKEVEKLSKKKLSLKEQDEWEDYFNEYKKDLSNLKNDIEKTDNEINKMVYKLYGLSKDEIDIIEESLK